jgi:hypothetical protein
MTDWIGWTTTTSGATTTRRAAVTPNRHGSAVVELPNDLDVVITREFDAPIALVFDVLTKPEHVRNIQGADHVGDTFDQMEDLLRSMLDRNGTVSG